MENYIRKLANYENITLTNREVWNIQENLYNSKLMDELDDFIYELIEEEKRLNII